HTPAPSNETTAAPSSPVSPALSARSWKSFENTVKKDWNKAKPYVQGAAQIAGAAAPYLMHARDVDASDVELDERSWASFKNTVKNDWNKAKPGAGRALLGELQEHSQERLDKAKPYVQAAGNVAAGAAQVAGNLAPYLAKAPKARSLDDDDSELQFRDIDGEFALDERSWASFKNTVRNDWNKAKPYVKGAAQVAAAVAPLAMRDVDVDELDMDERSMASAKAAVKAGAAKVKTAVKNAGVKVKAAAQKVGASVKSGVSRAKAEVKKDWPQVKAEVKKDWQKAKPVLKTAGQIAVGASQVASNLAPYLVKNSRRDLSDTELEEREWEDIAFDERDLEDLDLDERSWASFKNTVKNDWNKAKPYVQAAGNVAAGAAQVASNLAPYLAKAPKARSLEDLD
ncbi:hypothetical protein DACRYDRAFT_23054, partial [Dacryopinax primogenitus]